MKKPIKVCSCGKCFYELPESAKFFLDDDGSFFTGYWWDCDCKSSCFLPVESYLEGIWEAA